MALLLFAGAVRPSTATAQDFEISSVSVGIEGQFKIGDWSPISFDIVGPAKSKCIPVIIVPDPDGHPTRREISEVSISEGDTAHVTTLFRLGRWKAPLQIQLEDLNGTILASETIPTTKRGSVVSHKQRTQLWVSVGEQPAFQHAANRWNQLDPEGVVALTVDGMSAFPAESLGFSFIDLIVISSKVEITSAQNKALREWVQRGGNLIISFGDHADEFNHSELANWCPIKPTGVIDIRNLSGLQAAVPGSAQLRLLGTLPAAQFDRKQGAVLAKGISGPLIKRAAYGAGQVTVTAVDLNQRPLSDWDSDSQSDLAALLANTVPAWRNDALEDILGAANELTPTGISDLQTQLVHNLDRFDAVSRGSHWHVLGWIALVIVIIGPLDFALLHYVIKKPHLTWYTLPCWLGLSAFLATTLSANSNNHEIQGRQVSFVDIDTTVDRVRTRSWMNFYSPETRRRTVSAKGDSALQLKDGKQEFLKMSWTSRPETGFRGMYRPGESNNSRASYSYSSNHDKIENLPTRIWSSASTHCEWEAAGKTNQFFEANFSESATDRLQGTITSKLPVKIHDWVIAHGNFAYYPKSNSVLESLSLQPNVPIEIDDLRSNLLRGLMIGQTHNSYFESSADDENPVIVRNEYNSASQDTFGFARFVTFHELVGGTSYTALENQSLDDLDLSHLLKLDRAVLLGRVVMPATDFEVDGSAVPLEMKETFIRVIFTVKPRVRTQDTAPDKELLKLP